MVATREKRTPLGDPKWTRRQLEVLELLSQGYTNPRIADHLGISLDGAKWHVAEILDRLNVESREEAADYWRARNGMRPRLARMASAVGGAFSVRWLGPMLAGAGLLALGAFAGLVLSTRGGEDTDLAQQQQTPAATSPTPATTAGAGAATTPVATPTPDPALPETIAGAPVRRLEIRAPEVPLRELVVYFAQGCWQCDGPAVSIDRSVIFVDGNETSVRNESLLAGDAQERIQSHWIVEGGAEQWVSLCIRGSCGGLEPVSDDARTRLKRSVDGGATWRHIADVDGALRILGRQGGSLIAARMTPGLSGLEATYETYPGGTRIAPPNGASRLAAVSSGSLTWQGSDGTSYLDENGSAVIDGDWDTERQPGSETRLVSPGGYTVSLVQWSRADGTFVGVADRDELKVVYGLPGANWSLEVATWLDDDKAVGLIHLPAGLVPGSTVTGDAAEAIIPLPALIDVERGSVTPLLLFGPVFEGGAVADAYSQQRNQVLAAVERADTVYRVSAPEDCLYLRDRPSLEAATLTCMADGVLVTAPDKDPVSADGMEWAVVTTVDGQQGWASLSYLER